MSTFKQPVSGIKQSSSMAREAKIQEPPFNRQLLTTEVML